MQGSRPKPYGVTIAVKTLAARQWGRRRRALAAEAIFAAKLLAGEMPQDIEGVQGGRPAALSRSAGDLGTECSCPDWSNPCKHIAAVYYLLGEEFDRDPFLIFRLRGLSREDLVEMVAGTVDEPGGNPAEPEVTLEPLPADPAGFWGAPPPDLDLPVDPATARGPAVLPHRLGPFPFWRGDEPFLEVMDQIYADAAGEALELLADPVGEEGQED